MTAKFQLSELFIEAAVWEVHLDFLAKHIKNMSLTVPAKALADHASCLHRILLLFFLCESYGRLMGKDVPI